MGVLIQVSIYSHVDRSQMSSEPKAYTRILNDGVETVPVSAIKTHPRNPRRGDLDAVSSSISVNGFYGSLVVNRRSGFIVAGNHRYIAAKELGYESLPVSWIDVGEAEERRILAADNRTSDLGGYDDAVLASLLESLQEDETGLDGTGYSDDDLGELLDGLLDGFDDDDSESVSDLQYEKSQELLSKWGVELGQIWEVGRHRLMCGDCRSAEQVERLLDGQLINVAFTSPPYASQRKYDESSAFKPVHPDEYVEWFEPVQANIRSNLAPDGSWFVNIKAHAKNGQRSLYVKDLVLAHVRSWAWRFVDEFCWERIGTPGCPKAMQRFKSQWEPIFHLSIHPRCKFNPEAVAYQSDGSIIGGPWSPSLKATSEANRSHLGAKTIGRGLAYPGNRLSFHSSSARSHPAAFPIGLPTFFVKAYSDDGDVIYDPFHGSGTTAAACDPLGRRCFGMEISPVYVAIQLERLSDLGLSPRLLSADTDKTSMHAQEAS
jgi:site-specific DNA-methyltransferase (adenine-specific)/site-specific DNA-methyltransferase (cytosine-N4-specific)